MFALFSSALSTFLTIFWTVALIAYGLDSWSNFFTMVIVGIGIWIGAKIKEATDSTVAQALFYIIVVVILGIILWVFFPQYH